MDALPISGKWQSYGRMPEESVYIVVKDVGKYCGLCRKLTLKWQLGVEEKGGLGRHVSSRYVTPVWSSSSGTIIISVWCSLRS